MKTIAIIQSKRGHQEVDYLIKISPKEFTVLKAMVSIAKMDVWQKGNSLDTTITSIRRFFRESTSKPIK